MMRGCRIGKDVPTSKLEEADSPIQGYEYTYDKVVPACEFRG